MKFAPLAACLSGALSLGLLDSARAQNTPLPGPTMSDAAPTPALVPSTITPPGPVPAEVHHTRRLVRDVQSNTDNIKANGNFGAQLWMIGNEDFFENWRKPESPTIDPIDLAVRGQPLYTAIIFYGESKDDKGLAYITYDITVKRPDGTVYGQRKAMVGYQNLAPSDDHLLQLGHTYMTIDIGPEDPAGLYTIETVVHDNAARIELPLVQHFVVQPAP